MEYASKGIANAGLATGIIGTTLGALDAMGGGLGTVLQEVISKSWDIIGHHRKEGHNDTIHPLDHFIFITCGLCSYLSA